MINDILRDREKRYNEVLLLCDKYKLPVLCGKINYPGDNKNTKAVNKAFLVLLKLLQNSFAGKIKYKKTLNGFDGPSAIMTLNMDSMEAKKLALNIEENEKLGRVFDIDIYIENGTSIGRNEMNLKSRVCVVCDENARICTREGKHSLQEVKTAINTIIDEYGECND